MLHGIGATLARRLGPERLDVHPHPSAFALACARLGWPAADVELVSAVARPPEVVARVLQPGRRVVVYVTGADGARTLARVVSERGFGGSRLVVLEQLGAPGERVTEATAQTFDASADPLHAVAIEVGDGPLRALVPGPARRRLRERRAADQAPRPRDHARRARAGARRSCCGTSAPAAARSASSGCGPSRPRARSASNADAARAERIERNALALGVPDRLTVIRGRAPEALAGLDAPDGDLRRRRRHEPRAARRLLGRAGARRPLRRQRRDARGRAGRRRGARAARRHADPHRDRPRRAARRLHGLAGADARRAVGGDQAMTVHFIGAGPGAPDLLTLRGRDLIASSPVCLYAGALVPPEILAHAPAGRAGRRHAGPDARRDRRRAARPPTRAGRTSRGCTPATSRSTAPRPSRCAASTRSASRGTSRPGVPAFAAAAASAAPRAHDPRGRADGDPHALRQARLGDAGGRAARRPRGPRRHARDPPRRAGASRRSPRP